MTLSYIAAIALILMGDPVFAALNVATPPLILQARESQISSVFLVWMIGNTISHNLLNSGAFEVTLNEHQVWSKIDTGRVPTWPELIKGFEEAGLNRHLS